MNKNLLVSIVTIAFNGEEYIEQTIKSVLSQTYMPIEYIVIDGESTDGTLKIIHQYSDQIDKIISEHDNGIYDAINKGIACARGSIVGIIHCGDYYDKDAVEVVVEAFSQSEANVVYGDICAIEKENTRKECRFILKSNHTKLKKRMTIFHPAAFVSKECYEMYGLYNVMYKSAADYEFFLRLFCDGVKFHQVNQVVAYFRTGGTSSKMSVSLQENMKIRKEHLGVFSAWQYSICTCAISGCQRIKKKIGQSIIGKSNYAKLKQWWYSSSEHHLNV